MKENNGSVMAWMRAADFVHGLFLGAMATLLLSVPTSDSALRDQAAIVEKVEYRLESESRVREQAALERGRIEASFRTDPQLGAALGLLHNKKEFSRRIGG